MSKFSKSSLDFTDENTVSIINDLPLWSAPFGFALLNTIILKKNSTVLDIGSGLGFPMIEVSQRLGGTCKMYGLDPWKQALARSKKKIDIFGLKNIELIEGIAEEIPLPDSSVDLIISNNGINNVQNIEKVFQECKRISKLGAQFVATVNMPETMIEFYEIFKSVLNDFDLHDYISVVDTHIYNKRKPLDELEKIFSDNSFKIKNIKHDSFKYRFTDGTTMFQYRFIQYAFLESWMNLIPANLIDRVFSEIESRMNQHSEIYGEWLLTVPFITIDAIRI